MVISLFSHYFQINCDSVYHHNMCTVCFPHCTLFSLLLLWMRYLEPHSGGLKKILELVN